MKWLRFCFHKAYFDKGYGLTSYIKYGIALFGLSSLDVRTTMMLGLGYGILCYIIGRLWFHYGFQEADTEVYNIFNPFVKEMRNKRFK